MSDVFMGLFVSVVGAIAAGLFGIITSKGPVPVRIAVALFAASAVFLSIMGVWRWSIGA